MAYSVPPLPYPYDALEPHIDKLTMEIHHDKHHQAYVDKVNAALEGTALVDTPIEDVLRDLGQVPDVKRTALATWPVTISSCVIASTMSAPLRSFSLSSSSIP